MPRSSNAAPPVGRLLNPALLGSRTEELLAKLGERVIGQNDAIAELVRAYVNHKAGLGPAGRPVGNYLLVGPTGCGKTLVCQTVAELITGKRDALVRIDCAEYQDRHEVSKLIGSPPGYLGHRETQPAITQLRIDRQYSEDCQIAFILFDEIDKAHPGLLNLLLGVMDYGSLRLGDNSVLNFEKTVILMTANTGAKEMQESLSPTWGYAAGNAADGLIAAGHAGASAARRSLTPEMMNRIDKILVFQQLDRQAISQVMDLELGKLHDRLLNAKQSIALLIEPEAREFIIDDGYDARYGARHLKRSLVQNLETPIANLLVSEQIRAGSRLRVARGPAGLEFSEL